MWGGIGVESGIHGAEIGLKGAYKWDPDSSLIR